MSPIPLPHSTKHCSYEIRRVEEDSVGYVVFSPAFCCSSNLVPHALRATAPADGRRATNCETMIKTAAVKRDRDHISHGSYRLLLQVDTPARVNGRMEG